jgi:hypothetical protein
MNWMACEKCGATDCGHSFCGHCGGKLKEMPSCSCGYKFRPWDLYCVSCGRFRKENEKPKFIPEMPLAMPRKMPRWLAKVMSRLGWN